MITVLCAKKKSLYKQIPGLDVWDQDRDAYYFTGSNPVITHAPCAQWSQMKGFANDNPDEKELAYFCLQKVLRNGGIFEHPRGSSFFREAGVDRNIYSVDQSWWGFPAKKATWLFFHRCKPEPFPIMPPPPTRVIAPHRHIKGGGTLDLPKSQRSTTTIPFAQWMIDSINKSI